MAVNSCFKIVFIFFNILTAVGGVLLLGLGIFASASHHGIEQQMSGVFFLFVIGGCSLALSIFGAYGAHREKKWALIVFFTGMVLGGLGLLLIAMSVSVGMPAAIQAMDKLFRESIPLDEARSEVQMILNKAQPALKCCGAFQGYQDWGKHVPDSCLCSSVADKCEKMNSSQSALDDGRTPDSPFGGSEKLVYKEPCLPLIIGLLEKALNTVLGVCIGFGIMALIGMVMSMTMICQIRRGGSPGNSPPYSQFRDAMDA